MELVRGPRFVRLYGDGVYGGPTNEDIDLIERTCVSEDVDRHGLRAEVVGHRERRGRTVAKVGLVGDRCRCCDVDHLVRRRRGVQREGVVGQQQNGVCRRAFGDDPVRADVGVRRGAVEVGRAGHRRCCAVPHPRAVLRRGGLCAQPEHVPGRCGDSIESCARRSGVDVATAHECLDGTLEGLPARETGHCGIHVLLRGCVGVRGRRCEIDDLLCVRTDRTVGRCQRVDRDARLDCRCETCDVGRGIDRPRVVAALDQKVVRGFEVDLPSRLGRTVGGRGKIDDLLAVRVQYRREFPCGHCAVFPFTKLAPQTQAVRQTQVGCCFRQSGKPERTRIAFRNPRNRP